MDRLIYFPIFGLLGQLYFWSKCCPIWTLFYVCDPLMVLLGYDVLSKGCVRDVGNPRRWSVGLFWFYVLIWIVKCLHSFPIFFLTGRASFLELEGFLLFRWAVLEAVF